jgi:hypothetical protein
VRINVYVDGFNLYHRALRNARAPDGSTYKWLDLEKLAAQVLSNPAYTIRRIRYFTARVRALPGDPQAPLRQQMYLRALATLSSVTVHFGFFQKSQKKMQLVKAAARRYDDGEGSQVRGEGLGRQPRDVSPARRVPERIRRRRRGDE